MDNNNSYYDVLTPGKTIHNCPEHNPPLAPNLPRFEWARITPTLYRGKDRIIPEDKQHLYPRPTSIFHVMKNFCAGTDSPTESDCDIVEALSDDTEIWYAHCKEGLRVIWGHKILVGPPGTKNKYLNNRCATKDDPWSPDYVGLGKFKDYGYFLDQTEALRYHNEMLYKDIAVIQEKIAENNTWLFHLKDQETPFVDVYNSGCPCCGYPRCDHNHEEPLSRKMTKVG